MKRILILFLILLALPGVVLAQSDEYRLDFTREFGYGSGSNVRGRMSLDLEGSLENVASVTYYIDGSEMATLSQAPFKFLFSTGSYPVGVHTFTATVRTRDGREVTTQGIQRNFISSEEESQTMQRIIIPLVGGVFIVMLIGVGFQMYAMRNRQPLPPGAPRSYGMQGGAICPRCGRAYSRHIWGLNALLWKFDRCDHCGKWAFVRRATPVELAQAEQAELEAYQASERSLPGAQDNPESEEERLRKMLDESKFSK